MRFTEILPKVDEYIIFNDEMWFVYTRLGWEEMREIDKHMAKSIYR